MEVNNFGHVFVLRSRRFVPVESIMSIRARDVFKIYDIYPFSQVLGRHGDKYFIAESNPAITDNGTISISCSETDLKGVPLYGEGI